MKNPELIEIPLDDRDATALWALMCDTVTDGDFELVVHEQATSPRLR